MAKQFTYGGYTFEPRGTFKDFGLQKRKKGLTDKEWLKISNLLCDLSSGKVADGNEKFNYDEFYKAAGEDCKADVFYCVETKELYVPCGFSLQIFVPDRNFDEVEKRYVIRQLRKEPHWQNCRTYEEKLTDDEVQNFANEFTSRLLREKYGEAFDLIDNVEDYPDINHDWEVLNEKFYNIIDEFAA